MLSSTRAKPRSIGRICQIGTKPPAVPARPGMDFTVSLSFQYCRNVILVGRGNGAVLEEEEAAECPRCEARKNRQRAWRRWFAAFLVFITVAGVAGIPVYVFPRTDHLQKADAIFILGGYGYRKLYGFSLYDQGWAPNVIMAKAAGGPQTDAENMWIDRWCTTTYWGSELRRENKPWPTTNKFCPVADPPTTLGEARALRSLAKQHGWHSVIVVTFKPHIARARYVFEQCFDGEVIMSVSPVEIPITRWVYEYAYQTAGFVKALFQDC